MVGPYAIERYAMNLLKERHAEAEARRAKLLLTVPPLYESSTREALGRSTARRASSGGFA